MTRATMGRRFSFTAVGASAAFTAIVTTLAGCGGSSPALHEGGFFVPDEGRVVNLSRSSEGRATTLTAPALLGGERATVAQLEPGRLVAPLIVIDVQQRARLAPEFTFGADDLAEFEGRRGGIPTGAFVVLQTGGGSATAGATLRHPGFSPAVVDLLIKQRGAVGVGSDAPAIDSSAQPEAEARRSALTSGRFVVTNLSGLDQVVEGRAVVFLGAPLVAAQEAPVRVLALVPRRAAQGSR